MHKQHSESGFTLIEMLITVGIIAALAAIVIVGVNPARQISNTRNAQRFSNIGAVQSAVNHYAIETFTGYPAGIDSTLRMIGTSASGCAVTCGPDALPPPPPPSTISFADDTLAEFGAGTHTNTQWNAGTSAVGLNAAGLTSRTGTYLSRVFDGGSSVTWNSLSWLPRGPYGKALPSPSTATETGYPTGNASMASNVLLMRADETSGTIVDVSGSSNNGTNVGATYGATGKFNKGLTFNGSSAYVQVNSVPNLNLPNTGGTVMLWIKATINITTIPQNTGMGIIRKPDFNGNLIAPGGYGLEIFRNTPTGPTNLKMSLGSNNGFTSTNQSIVGATNLQTGVWYHVAMNWSTGTMNLYLNGVLDATATRTTAFNWNANQYSGTEKLYIGRDIASQSTARAWFNGMMDEIAIFGRQLSAPEIASAYQRGAYYPKLRIRSCNDAVCAGETFVGPNGTAGTYFSEEANTTLIPAVLTPNVTANQYFQYQLVLDTDTQSGGPEVASVSGGNNGTPSGGGGSGTSTTEDTAEACLDLTSALVPTYMTSLPIDPKTGSLAKTYYAIKKIGMDGITVRACSPELGKSIQLSQ